MKMMKLLASYAMVGALTAVCASGAFAASSADICSDYVADEGATTGYVTVTPGEYTAAGDYTVLVYPAQVEVDGETVNLDESAEISDAYIKQIDQNSTGSFTLKFNGLADGKYYVRLGGDENGYVYDTFTVGETGNEPSRVKGDVVGTVSGEINLDDTIAVLEISVSSGTWDDDQIYAADVVGSVENEVNLDDVIAVLEASVGADVEFKK